ncbi:MAG: hypothetical protein U0166_23740 [Acidobacteriota bacterium]
MPGVILALLLPLAAPGFSAPPTFRVEDGGKPAGAIEIAKRDDGWIVYEDRRGDAKVHGELRYDEAGSIVGARFFPKGQADAVPVEVAVADGDVTLAVGDQKKNVVVPLTFKSRVKPGRVFSIMATLQPAVLLGAAPLAIASSRTDTEVAAIVVDPADGLKGTPRFWVMRLVRERKPRKVELRDGGSVDAWAIDLEVEKNKLISIIAGDDGEIYAYRMLSKDSARFGETGFSTKVK